MTPLEQAIKIAIQNGFPSKLVDNVDYIIGRYPEEPYVAFFGKTENRRLGRVEFEEMHELIFDHEFAKALWGSEDVCSLELNGVHRELAEFHIDADAYQYHLAQLALSTDRLKYLADNMPKEET